MNKIKITEAQYEKLKEALIKESTSEGISIVESKLNEISADKIMGAANKMWQEKIGGNHYNENPRAKKLLTDYANKLLGLKLFNGELNKIVVDLIANGSKSFFLIFNILTNGEVSFGSNRYIGLFYNYSTDQFMVGSQIDSNLIPISEFSNTSISKHDARQLYKIANHLNPKTRYVNFTREIPINVEI